MPKTVKNRVSSKRTQPKPAMQARAVRTRSKLLDALEELLRTKAFELISVNDIAVVAGVSVGSVYSHFSDKDAFLEALLETWRERVMKRLAEVQASDLEAEYQAEGGLRQTLQMIVSFGYAQIVADSHIIKATHNYFRLCADVDWHAWEEIRIAAFKTIAMIVDVYEDEIQRKDLKRAGYMLNYFLSVIISERVIYKERSAYGAMKMSEEEFIAEVVDMAYAYLTSPVR